MAQSWSWGSQIAVKKVILSWPYHDNKYITDFKEKANLINQFFAKQCTLTDNSSILPTGSSENSNELLTILFSRKNDIAKI